MDLPNLQANGSLSTKQKGFNNIKYNNEPPHDKTNKMVCTPIEDSDQPGHPPSLIRVFAVRSVGSWRPTVSSWGGSNVDDHTANRGLMTAAIFYCGTSWGSFHYFWHELLDLSFISYILHTFSILYSLQGTYIVTTGGTCITCNKLVI